MASFLNKSTEVKSKFSGRATFVDMVQTGIKNLEQERTLTKTPISENPDRQFYQSTVPMDQRITENEAVGVFDSTITTIEPATDQPIPEKPDVETKELPDAPAASGVQPTDGKVDNSAPKREDLINSVFKAEGGYSEDKADSGNYINGKFIGTNHGISAPILADYLGREPTVDEMKNLTKDKAREIAATRYYDRFKINLLPNNLQEIVFHAVFMGETRGVRAIQNLLGLTPDGVLGPDTEVAMQKADFTKEDFKNEFLRELEFGTSKNNPKTNEPYSKPSPSWNFHNKGWTDRYKELAK